MKFINTQNKHSQKKRVLSLAECDIGQPTNQPTLPHNNKHVTIFYWQ